jgi:hypothetical protein
VRPGDLVKVKRSTLGVPVGTLGLIIHSYDVRGDYDTNPDEKIHELQLIGPESLFRRYLDRDLEVINESR